MLIPPANLAQPVPASELLEGGARFGGPGHGPGPGGVGGEAGPHARTWHLQGQMSPPVPITVGQDEAGVLPLMLGLVGWVQEVVPRFGVGGCLWVGA